MSVLAFPLKLEPYEDTCITINSILVTINLEYSGQFLTWANFLRKKMSARAFHLKWNLMRIHVLHLHHSCCHKPRIFRTINSSDLR